MSYWLTPPELRRRIVEILGEEFYDPCPFPKPTGHDALTIPWGNPWYCNAPFSKKDGPGITAFARKAAKEGGKGVFIYPDASHALTELLLAGAELEYAGEVAWLDTETNEPWRRPHPVWLAKFGVKE